MSDIADLTSALGTTSKFLHVLAQAGLTKQHVQFVIDNTAVRKNIVDVINDALETEMHSNAATAAKSLALQTELDDRRKMGVREDLLRAFLLEIKSDGGLNRRLDMVIADLNQTHTSEQIIKALIDSIRGRSLVYHHGLDGSPKLPYTKIAAGYTNCTASNISQGAKRSLRTLVKVLKEWSGEDGKCRQADALVEAGLVTPDWLPSDTTVEDMKAYRKVMIQNAVHYANRKDNYYREYSFQNICANHDLLIALGGFRNIATLLNCTEVYLRSQPRIAPYVDEIKANLAHYELSLKDDSISDN